MIKEEIKKIYNTTKEEIKKYTKFIEELFDFVKALIEIIIPFLFIFISLFALIKIIKYFWYL